jgi:hypothetical protein
MLLSMAVVLALVGVAFAFNAVQQPEPIIRDIDYTGALAEARERAAYDVLAPEPLPAGWRATSARTRARGDGLTWHLGMVTSSGSYAAVEQTDGRRAGFVVQFVGDARRAGTATVAGAAWRRLEDGEPEERALVRTEGGVTTVVTGGAGWGELELLARSLRG